STEGAGATQGDAIVDRITLSLADPGAATSVYEAELARSEGGEPVYTAPDGVASDEISGSGGVELAEGETVTFWVYGASDAEATLDVDLLAGGDGTLTVNGHDVLDLSDGRQVAAHLYGGVNKVTVTGGATPLVVARLTVGPGQGVLPTTEYQAEDARLGGRGRRVARRGRCRGAGRRPRARHRQRAGLRRRRGRGRGLRDGRAVLGPRAVGRRALQPRPRRAPGGPGGQRHAGRLGALP